MERASRWLCAVVVVGPFVGSVAFAGPGAPVPSAVAGPSASASSSTATVDFAILTGSSASASTIPSDHPALAKPPWTMYSRYVVSTAKPMTLVVGQTLRQPVGKGHLVALTLVAAGAKPHLEVVLTSASSSASAKASVTVPGKWAYPFHVPQAGGGLVVAVRP